MFDAVSYYKAIRGTNANSFPWKSIWHVKAPRGVSFFFFLVWTSAWGKILTNDCDAVCVSVLVKWLIIYCSIVTLLMLCGVKYLRCLRFSGGCH